MNTLIVIPARLASTRLPGKMLLDRTGKPLIQHTYEAACKATMASRVVVATDHEKIFQAVQAFGGEVVMTRADHATGTDRIAEAVTQFSDADIVVNVQGDEPEIEAESIDSVIRLLEQHPHVPMSTLATPIRDPAKLDDPACVKVVCNANGEAMYFSRSAIPHARANQDESRKDRQRQLATAGPTPFLLHLGVYAYRREFLFQFSQMESSPLERLESLEQLRALERGFTILVGTVESAPSGIDTEADYAAFVSRQSNC